MHREKASRARGIAKVLAEARFDDEARGHLLEAILHRARMFAVERRLPEPDNIQQALLPPLSTSWGESLPALREYLADETKPCRAALEAFGSSVFMDAVK